MKKTLILLFLTSSINLFAQTKDELLSEIESLKIQLEQTDKQISALQLLREEITAKIKTHKAEINRMEILAGVKGGTFEVNITGTGKMRAEPKFNSEELYQIPNGTIVTLFSDFYKSPYVKIEYNGLVGYISTGSLQRNDELKALTYDPVREKEKQERLDARYAYKEDPKYQNFVKKYGEGTALKIYRHQVWMGMSKSMLRDSKGSPESKTETKLAGSPTSYHWHYKNGDYYSFEADKLKYWSK